MAPRCKLNRSTSRLIPIVLMMFVIANILIFRFLLKKQIAVENSKEKDELENVAVGTRTKSVPPMDYEFVIAHYKEKLDWLRPVAKFCHVYDKGHVSELKPQFSVNNWEELPNFGRESHTYLHHIIENYDSLANITIFLRGEITSHAPKYCFQSPNEFLEKARTGVLCASMGQYRDWGKLKHSGAWKRDWDSGLMRHANMTVGQFYQMAFGKAPPTSINVCYAGCFSATRSCLQRHPKKFYQKLISHLFDHSHPEEGYYLERLWFTIAAC